MASPSSQIASQDGQIASVTYGETPVWQDDEEKEEWIFMIEFGEEPEAVPEAKAKAPCGPARIGRCSDTPRRANVGGPTRRPPRFPAPCTRAHSHVTAGSPAPCGQRHAAPRVRR